MDGGREPEAFEEFFRTQYPALVALGQVMLGSRAAGEDVAQDALAIVLRNWDEVDGYERPGAYARRIVINRALNEQRRRGRERTATGRMTSSADLTSSDPAELLGHDAELWGAVAELPPRQRAAVVLRHGLDLSTEQVGNELGCSHATARVHLFRAHRTLAALLAESDVAVMRSGEALT